MLPGLFFEMGGKSILQINSYLFRPQFTNLYQKIPLCKWWNFSFHFILQQEENMLLLQSSNRRMRTSISRGKWKGLGEEKLNLLLWNEKSAHPWCAVKVLTDSNPTIPSPPYLFPHSYMSLSSMYCSLFGQRMLTLSVRHCTSASSPPSSSSEASAGGGGTRWAG